MDSHGKDRHGKDRTDEVAAAETPEDVAVLYSWANLHGAKYRDFSASRREYRAQLRHRAAEQVREQALLAQAEAEAAASAAETEALQAAEAAQNRRAEDSDSSAQRSLRQAEVAARTAASERVEAARRAEVAAVAEAAARREEREIAEAHASAQRQAARYADSEIRRRANAGAGTAQPDASYPMPTAPSEELHASGDSPSGEETAPTPQHSGPRRPQGYRPDQASGVRQIYRGPDSDAPLAGLRATAAFEGEPPAMGQRRTDPQQQEDGAKPVLHDPDVIVRSFASLPSDLTRPVSPFSQALIPSDSTRGRRAQDDFDYKQSQRFSESPRRASGPLSEAATQRFPYVPDSAGPAWLYAPPVPPAVHKPPASQPPPQSSVADTLQHSRERVAARWFALKGVFEQPGQDQAEVVPVRQKETRTPVLAVFSLAGGVGKTSLVATVGRALSSLGEKVLLTDTTSHGLLPFYFGASELRHGTVRTFSPPSGSTDAPIYLVSYDVDQKASDEAAQEHLTEEIVSSSRGTHRILLDLTVNTAWIVRRMSRLHPTILVPVAPDMNSVISLQSIEKFFHGVVDGDGRPLQPFYVLNQFDTSLPLHLDVREVLRRQLGDRLLPFVIRRAPAVSEALAEGMTVVDYAPDAPVAEDYLNVATWLRTIAAPATAGFRNVRWSER